jgi:hypothetical protein
MLCLERNRSLQRPKEFKLVGSGKSALVMSICKPRIAFQCCLCLCVLVPGHSLCSPRIYITYTLASLPLRSLTALFAASRPQSSPESLLVSSELSECEKRASSLL